ncbi:MAG: AAA family ATPase [Proteobacteria bacterium]|nr:AAA family ATPase [Pseudomonadota bacterium]
MAIMYPPNPPELDNNQGGKRAERELHEQLRTQLDDEFYVYTNLCYVGGRIKPEGEADFLVLHRELGMLFIECKGRGITRDDQGQWWRGENKVRETPQAQADRLKWEIITKLKRLIRSGFPELNRAFPFVLGHAIAFPLGELGEFSNPPLDMDPEILMTSEDMPNLKDKVCAAFAYWQAALRTEVPTLDQRQFKRFRKHLLHPTLELVETVGAHIDPERRGLITLTEEQKEIMVGYLEIKRFRVPGGAGTGKTVLAVEAAKQFAESGRSVLLLCYNKQLGTYLKAALDAFDLGEHGGKADATHFHALCTKAHSELHGTAPDPPADEEGIKQFWENDMLESLRTAIAKGIVPKYDTIVVDEGQDFAVSWWKVLEDLFTDPEQARLVAFYDPSQEIFGRGCHVPDYNFFILNTNFRNTRLIAEKVHTLGEVEMQSHRDCPVGEAPVVREQRNPAQAKMDLEALIEKLVVQQKVKPEQIVILTPHARDNSLLAGTTELAGVPLTTTPIERGGAILHNTISAYKGLESDVVIMADIDPDDPLCNRNARYVAASRARRQLYVFSKGDWLG